MRNLFLGILFIFLIFASLAAAYANAALLLEEPHGPKGKFNPTGHAAVYLTRICADTPIHLRPCQAGEAGVVISRYNEVAGYDWVAIPLVSYLYAVNRVEEIPKSADEQTVAALRDRYRREHLMELAPDGPQGEAPPGHWVQLVGAAYVRKIYGFEIETTPEQDAAFIEKWNQRENRSHFNLLFSNCADFAASVLNFYAPHSVHRSFLADVGIMTPKQVARSFARHARKHPALEFSAFQVPQVPGTIRRSKSVNGVAETVVKSKKYVVPLALLNPTLTGSFVVAYFTNGRFDPKHNAEVFDIAQAFHTPAARVATATEPGAATTEPGAATMELSAAPPPPPAGALAGPKAAQ